ncbi:MAG: hypothetical protein RIC55_15860 [Pirellulaceae bacterium]
MAWKGALFFCHFAGWKEVEQCFCLPNQDSAWVIELERADGCATDSGQACDMDAFPAEFITPGIASGMEQRRLLLIVGGMHHDAVGFVKIATWTSPRQVVKLRTTAERTRDDVFDVKGRPL